MAFAIAFELHTEVLHLIIIRLYYHTALLLDDVLYPALLIVVEGYGQETHPSPTTAPWSLYHYTTMQSQLLPYLDESIGTTRLTNGAGQLQLAQQLYCLLAMRQIANHSDIILGWYTLHTPAQQKRAKGQIPSPWFHLINI